VGASFGPHALDVLQTPLLFEGEVDLARFITAGGASPLLEQLTPLGLVGLAVLPGEFRRPVGITRPLVAADDWSGAVIRTHSSLPGFAALRSLGATPVLRTAAELGAGVPEGVDDMDLHPTALLRWRFPGWLTENVLLWPRTLLLAAGERSFARLAEPEQQLIRTAAARAAHTAAAALLRRALVGWAYPPHVRVVQARDEELDVLRRTLTVVRDELAAQPQTGWALEHLRARTTRGGG
jgi:TRAP-type C4-dicarboxylate transport system substrate-binding protein